MSWPVSVRSAPIAALTTGLEPRVEAVHADRKADDSLACDLMEPVRQQVDAFLLRLLESHTFAARDFLETRQGVCRLMPPLTQLLAETQPRWAKAVAPVAEGAIRTSFEPERRAAKRNRIVPTLLTEANRSAARVGLRRKAKTAQPGPTPSLPPACLDCGVLLDDLARSYCDGCLPGRRQVAVGAFSAAGPNALAKLLTDGRDPAHGGEAARKRGQSNAEHVIAIQEWDQSLGPHIDDVDFVNDILSRLRSVPLRLMAEATGLSLGYCSFIRRGTKVPHPRHWKALRQL